MARITSSVCKLCRREGLKLFLKGSRCFMDKCAIEKRSYAPGQHGRRRAKVKEYGVQLREKQKVKRVYGVLERQFRKYFAQADRQKGVTGENLLMNLELRLDNVVYKAGFGASRPHARQMVLHGKVRINDKKVTIASYPLSEGDVLSLVDAAKKNADVQTGFGMGREIPAWLELDRDAMTAKVSRLPLRADITFPITESHIVELYSR